MGGGASLTEELSAASWLAVDIFFDLVSPTSGLMGLSGDMSLIPSCSAKKKSINRYTASVLMSVSDLKCEDKICIYIIIMTVQYSCTTTQVVSTCSFSSIRTFNGSGSLCLSTQLHAVLSHRKCLLVDS